MGYTIHSLELSYLVKEWQILLQGRIDKIYQNDQGILIKLFLTGKGNVFLIYQRPAVLYLTKTKPPSNEQLPHFAQFLRKHLANARIRAVEQLSKRERLIKLTLEKATPEQTFIYYLYFEFRNPGNVVLTDEKNIILMALQNKQFSTRVIRPKVPYHLDMREDLTEDAFLQLLETSDKPLVKTLALDCALGGIYAEELCQRATLEKNKQSQALSQEEKERLWHQYQELFHQPIHPHHDENHVYPFPLGTKTLDPAKEQGYNEALAAFLQALQTIPQEDPQIKRKESIIQQQELQLKTLEEEAAQAQRKGEHIYEHYHELQQLYEQIHQYKEEGKSLKEMKPLLLKQFPFLKAINEKNQSITVEFNGE